MTLQQLIKDNAWLSVANILLALYPDEEKNISDYERVYEALLQMPPIHSNLHIVVAERIDEYDGEKYVEVFGRHPQPQNKDEHYAKAIEFTPWNEWLGMEISPDSVAQFTELEIIAHCLYEMTFVGFEEVQIQQELKKLQQQIEALQQMTDEERKANTYTLEELKKKWALDDSENSQPSEPTS